MKRRIVQAPRSPSLFALVMVAGWAAGCRSRAPANPGGLDGAAGSAGSEAGGGGGGMRAATMCPASAPTAGTPCQPPSTCQYGSDPRSRDCRTYAECGAANTWTVSVPTVGYPSYCVPLTVATDCPASVTAAQGQTCSTDFSFCDIGGSPCVCTACPWNGGRLGMSCGTTVTWHCQTHGRETAPIARCWIRIWAPAAATKDYLAFITAAPPASTFAKVATGWPVTRACVRCKGDGIRGTGRASGAGRRGPGRG
jgi:hypothetical protein